jgi:hypothetical protein
MKRFSSFLNERILPSELAKRGKVEKNFHRTTKKGQDVDYYHPKTGEKRDGKITSHHPHGLSIKDTRTKEVHKFQPHHESVEESNEVPEKHIRMHLQIHGFTKRNLPVLAKKMKTYKGKRVVHKNGKLVTEEGGAGEVGTDELRKKYQKDTPCHPVTKSATSTKNAKVDEVFGQNSRLVKTNRKPPNWAKIRKEWEKEDAKRKATAAKHGTQNGRPLKTEAVASIEFTATPKKTKSVKKFSQHIKQTEGFGSSAVPSLRTLKRQNKSLEKILKNKDRMSDSEKVKAVQTVDRMHKKKTNESTSHEKKIINTFKKGEHSTFAKAKSAAKKLGGSQHIFKHKDGSHSTHASHNTAAHNWARKAGAYHVRTVESLQKEEVAANNTTGTPGAGDDNKTVVVRKRKPKVLTRHYMEIGGRRRKRVT